MAGDAAEPASGALARQLIEETRRDAAALEQDAAERKRQADEQEAAAEKAEARSKLLVRIALATLAGAVVVLLVGLAIVGYIAVDAGERAARAESARGEADIRAVAAELAEPVAVRVRDDGRAESIVIYRTELDTANRRLLGAGLPIVPVPGPGAPVAEVTRQSIRATLFADQNVGPDGRLTPLGELLVGAYRGLDTLPALAGLADPVPAPEGDITVTVLPDEPAPSRGDGFGAESPQPDDDDPRGRPPGPSRRPPPATQPAPAPAPPVEPPAAPRDRGLLTPCLLGRILC